MALSSGITFADMRTFNTQINTDCTNLWLGYSYCVARGKQIGPANPQDHSNQSQLPSPQRALTVVVVQVATKPFVVEQDLAIAVLIAATVSTLYPKAYAGITHPKGRWKHDSLLWLRQLLFWR